MEKNLLQQDNDSESSSEQDHILVDEVADPISEAAYNQFGSGRACSCCGDRYVLDTFIDYDGEIQGDTRMKDRPYDALAISLFKPEAYLLDEKKVELNDYEEGTAQHRAAIARIRQFYSLFMWTGAVLWSITIGAGLLFGYVAQADTAGIATVMTLVVAASILVIALEKTTVLASKTQFEGRNLARMIAEPTGMNKYHINAFFAILAMTGKLTRAKLVGQMLADNYAHLEEQMIFSFSNSALAPLSVVIDAMGLGGCAAIGYIVGPIILQGGYMLYKRSHIKVFLSEELPDYNSDLQRASRQYILDMQAIANWAMLSPAADVLGKVASETRAYWVHELYPTWMRLRAATCHTALKIISDNVFQLILLSRLWSYGYEQQHKHWQARAQLFFTIFLTWGEAVYSAVKLIRFNRRGSVAAGVIVLMLCVDPTARVLGTYVCESHIINLTSLSCSPKFD